MRTEQQQHNRRASNILYLGLGASLLFSVLGLSKTNLLPSVATGLPDMRPVLFGMILLVHLLEALLYYAIRIGKPWAKIVLLVLAVLSLLSFLNGEKTLDNGWSVAEVIMSTVTDVWALILLFKKPELPFR